MGTHLATMGVYNRNRRRTDATNARCPHGTVTPPKLTVITLIAQDIIWRAECTLPSATPYTRQGSCPLRAAVQAAVTRAVTQQSCELRSSEIIGTTMLQSLEVSDITSLHCNGEVLVDGDTLESRGVQTGGEVVMVINLEAVCERERQRKASVGPELKQQGTPDVRVPDATVQQRQAGRCGAIVSNAHRTRGSRFKNAGKTDSDKHYSNTHEGNVTSQGWGYMWQQSH